MKKYIPFTLGIILTLWYCLKVTRFWNGITDQWWMYHLNKSGVLLMIRQRKSTSLFVIILPGKNKLNDFELMRRYESFRVLFEALSVIAFCFGHLVNRGNFCLWNPEAWALELGIQLMESGIPLTIGVCNPVLGIRNPRCGIHNPRLSWIPLRGADCKQAWISKNTRQVGFEVSRA